MDTAEQFDCCCSHQSVASPCLCLCQGSHWTFWAHFTAAKMCLKRFTRCGHYTGEVEDITIGRLIVVS